MKAEELAAFVTSRPGEAFEVLWRVTLQAVGAWALTAPLIAGAVFFAVRPVLRGAARRLRPPRTTAAPAAGLEAMPVATVEDRNGR
jgi:hypothetical protein